MEAPREVILRIFAFMEIPVLFATIRPASRAFYRLSRLVALQSFLSHPCLNDISVDVVLTSDSEDEMAWGTFIYDEAVTRSRSSAVFKEESHSGKTNQIYFTSDLVCGLFTSVYRSATCEAQLNCGQRIIPGGSARFPIERPLKPVTAVCESAWVKISPRVVRGELLPPDEQLLQVDWVAFSARDLMRQTFLRGNITQ